MKFWMNRCSIEEVVPLRHRVLRVGRPRESAYFDNDHESGTVHYGLFTEAGIVVCLTLIRSVYDGSPAWQLRGMATDTSFQGMGWGSVLMDFALKDISSEGFATTFWCNARKGAVSFYEKNGWNIVSDEYEYGGNGPHYKMVFESDTVKNLPYLKDIG